MNRQDFENFKEEHKLFNQIYVEFEDARLRTNASCFAEYDVRFRLLQRLKESLEDTGLQCDLEFNTTYISYNDNKIPFMSSDWFDLIERTIVTE